MDRKSARLAIKFSRGYKMLTASRKVQVAKEVIKLDVPTLDTRKKCREYVNSLPDPGISIDPGIPFEHSDVRFIETETDVRLIDNETDLRLIKNDTEVRLIENETKVRLIEKENNVRLIENETEVRLIEKENNERLIENETEVRLIEKENHERSIENETEVHLIEKENHERLIENETEMRLIEKENNERSIENETVVRLIEKENNERLIENDTEVRLFEKDTVVRLIEKESNVRLHTHTVETCQVETCKEEVFAACPGCSIFMCYDHISMEYESCADHNNLLLVPQSNLRNDNTGYELQTVRTQQRDCMVTEVDHQSDIQNFEDDDNMSAITEIYDCGNMEIEILNEENEGQKRQRKIGQREITSKERILGRKYLGYSRSKEGVISNNLQRGEKKVRSRCSHVNESIKSNRSFQCARVCDNERNRIFENFWKMPSWMCKKTFVRAMVDTRPAIRQRNIRNKISEKPKKKEQHHDCYLTESSGRKVRVCKNFFIRTLDLGEDQFRRWTRSEAVPSENKNTRKESAQKKSHKSCVAAWIDKLPKVPSHYCRASTSRIYVESIFRSKYHLYSVYRDYERNCNRTAVSLSLFKKILKNKNISIHSPRKDQCDTCCAFETRNISKDEYDEHIIRKNEAFKAKEEAKASCNENTIVITMDLQSVLLSPRISASAVYYKQKLKLHNFTIFRLNDRKVDLYVWHEGEGGVTSNEFASCIVSYLRSLPDNVQRVITISDGCGYQNRNKTLSSALSDLAKEKSITVEQLILERGHTMMEADSVHSTLEQVFGKSPIYAPMDYLVFMRLARPKQPYDVHSIEHTFFLKYDDLPSNFSSIRPGKTAADPVVTDVHEFRYDPNGLVYYKLRHTDNWAVLPCRRRPKTCNPRPMYYAQLCITADKFRNLQELKFVIPPEYHAFYDNLTHD